MEQRLNYMTVGIFWWTQDYVARTLQWNVSQESAPSSVRMEGHGPKGAPATVQMGSLEGIAAVSDKAYCMLKLMLFGLKSLNGFIYSQDQ